MGASTAAPDTDLYNTHGPMSDGKLSAQRGTSLVEMLVATALGLVVLAGASPLFLQMLQQQTSAQQRLEQAEALRFASQIISQHVRDASRIMPNSHSTLLEVQTPGAIGVSWVSLACIQSADNDRLQLIYTPSAGSLSCKNATTNSPQQVLIDKLWPLQFEYGCAPADGTSATRGVMQHVSNAVDCPNRVVSVTVTALAPSTQSSSPNSPTVRWTTVNRVAIWEPHTP
jgi:type II secretory pathway pseudopilin PulG